MTTAPSRPPATGAAALAGVAVAVLVTGAAAAAVVGVTVGAPEAYGVVIGAGLAAGVLAFGTMTVAVVAALSPGMSLPVALLTYGLQLVLLLVALLAIERSGLLDGTVARRWLGATVIVGTLAWSAAQILVTVRRRVPLYDLTPTERSAEPDAGAK